MSSQKEDLARRIHRDLGDDFDEALELALALEDRTPERIASDGEDSPLTDADKDARCQYFRELFGLQAELVKLQDWVVATRHKVVILVEGRHAAGSGGVIKRVTRRLTPPGCRVAAMPAPNDRERTQRYLQRYASHLPAGGGDRTVRPQWVQARRGRAGDGLLHRRPARRVLPRGTRVRAPASATRHHRAPGVLTHCRAAHVPLMRLF